MVAKDYTQQLVDYFLKNLSKGYPLDSLKWALVKQGYSKTSIDKAVEKVHEELAKKAPKFKEKPKINYEILDHENNPIQIKTPWWRRMFG